MSHLLGDLRNKLLTENRVFSIGEANKVVNTIYNECVIATSDRFHGPFFYEICPLLTIANKLGDEVSSIQFTGAHSGFDGLLFVGDELEHKVEMTAAIDSHNDALQMELLAERRHAPAFQKVDAEGTKRNRQFGKNELSAFNVDDYSNHRLLPLLEMAIQRKTSKATTSKDYKNAWLGIVFDDHFQTNEDRKKARFDPLCRWMLGDSGRSCAPFSRVFFIGVSRAYIFDSDIDLARESEE